ncbi:MAG TPA: tRNA (adenosine(37)-N6)-dimethylallyltransferase MiaA [Blastocatellia bacterium]|nr:tRNA (adenosine(37)-N6)-dimethylallyltransferase MiaA [Blastocatellia bacterium]
MPTTGPPIIVIAGPTASGKSDLGIELSLRFNGEIINSDSVQVYKGLYVATAKVPVAEQRGISHHLIDVVDPVQNFTAGDFARLAGQKIEEIESRNHLAFLVGGTGFYLKALLGGLFEGAPTDQSFRSRVRKILDRRGAAHLHKMLRRVDPQTAERLSPNDWSRTTRALEVYFQTGQRLSAQQHRMPGPPDFARRIHMFVLNPPREALYDKINRRADAMFAAGLVDEVRALLDSGVPADAKAFGAHGYRRVIEYLQSKITLEQCIEQTRLDTRHYAKRQLTWWRNQAQPTWLNGFGNDPAVIAEATDLVKKLAESFP